MKIINKEEFLEIYNKHLEWLKDLEKGERLVWNFKINFTADLSGANLRGADLSGANLSGADLRYANLSGADLSGVDLSGADLRGANLRGANLRGANLRYADLSGADLRDVNLRGANLSYANLRDADLRGANLSGANIDFSSWGLSCKTNNVILCKKLQAQLLGHVMNVSPEISFSKEQVQFVKDNWSRFDEFCNDEIKDILKQGE